MAWQSKERRRAHEIKKNYGITWEQYIALVEDQNGRCAVCSDLLVALTGKTGAHVDHCHRTGRIRGVLCGPCNRGMGQFKDSEVRLRKAADYLAQNGASPFDLCVRPTRASNLEGK